MSVRPGSVKQARLDAGLSLGQVARSDISRTAIYFVETGKAKPSMETLRLIADRTGRPVDYFLAEPSTAPLPAGEIAQLEQMMARGDAVGAAARAEHLLGQRLDEESAARVKLLAALAYLRVAQPSEGRRYSAAARTYFERAGDVLMTAEAMGTQAQAAYMIEDPVALPLAEEALEKLHSLKSYPPATESRLLMILAGTHLNNGKWDEAIDTYERAIAAGDVVQDLHRLSLLYTGLTYAYEQSKQFSDAIRYAQKAIAIHETLRDQLSLARSLNNLGYMLVSMREFGSARRHIERAIAIFDEEGVEVGKANVMLSLCEAELGLGGLERAASLATAAAALAHKVGEPAVEAEAHMWLGRIAAERGERASCDAEFGAAVSVAEKLGPGFRLTQVHEAYAEILEARGDLTGANSHLKQALAATRNSARATQAKVAIA